MKSPTLTNFNNLRIQAENAFHSNQFNVAESLIIEALEFINQKEDEEKKLYWQQLAEGCELL